MTEKEQAVLESISGELTIKEDEIKDVIRLFGEDLMLEWVENHAMEATNKWLAEHDYNTYSSDGEYVVKYIDHLLQSFKKWAIS